MKFIPQRIPDVVLIEADVFGDTRGFFMESWHAQKFADAGIPAQFVQDNHSRSGQGILRGLHYQVCHPQGKLVRVTAGLVYDVVVDMRSSSPHFGQWLGVYLSAESKHQLWIPPGFAHGFYVLSEDAEFMYKCTDFYAPDCERAVRWDDPDLAIAWPLIPGQAPKLSAKDAAAPAFKSAEKLP